MAEVLENQYNVKKIAAKQDELTSLAREALKASPADETHVSIFSLDSSLTRFAGSEIHQNNFERQSFVSITARVGQREGQVATNQLTPAAMKDAVDRAVVAAKASEPNPDLAEIPEGPRDYPFRVEYFEPTAACTPEDRAKMVIKGFEVADDPAFTASGTLSTSQINRVIANSRGIDAAYNTTRSKYTVLFTGPDSSGYAEMDAQDVRDIEPEKLAVEAYATAKSSANPRNDVEAGKYTVVLGPECVATMLNFLTWVGLSGRDYNDGSSFMCGKLGEQITSSDLTVIDDPLDPRTMAVPSDEAGIPKQRLMLIESGVARAVAHDVNSAKKAGTVTTGHDTGHNYPIPVNLVMSPGTSSKEELIKGVKRGIYVSRFHYTNIVDPLATVITGMTRDGTYLIEDGKLTTGLTNFRFTQNILDAFLNCSGMSSEQVYHGAFWGGGCLVPEAIRVEGFNFSGKTEH